jgi:very-short-patch-repair endonuclease
MEKDWLKISGMHDGATPKVFKNAAKLRENMTEPEIKLWDYLKTKPLGYKFRRQHPIAGYVLDFYCHKLRLSIEIDGGYHLKKEQKEKDTQRTEYLKGVGIAEHRFTNEEILSNFKKTIEIINSVLCGGIPLGAGGERGQN